MSHYTSSCFSKCTPITFLWSLFNTTSSELFNGQIYGLNKANTSTRASICLTNFWPKLSDFQQLSWKSLSFRPGQHCGLCDTAQPFLKLWQHILKGLFPLWNSDKSQKRSKSRIQSWKTILRLTIESIRAAFSLPQCLMRTGQVDSGVMSTPFPALLVPSLCCVIFSFNHSLFPMAYILFSALKFNSRLHFHVLEWYIVHSECLPMYM